MSTTKRALSMCSSAFGRPRSAKMLPLLRVTERVVFFMMASTSFGLLRAVIIPVVLLRAFQASLDPVDVNLWRCRALLCFLLEGIEHIDDACEFHSVDCAVRVPVEVVDDLQNARS